ncbi:hypothetical protein KI387_015554, partial [Taxus chinensis]
MWSDSVNRSMKRFSYLLLDEGEFYVQDWIATCRQGSMDNSQNIETSPWQLHQMKGRLRLCSKSIFFEPDGLSVPIIRFPMHKVKKVEALTETPILPNYDHDKWQGRQESFVLEASLHVTMKENGIDAPYNFEKQDTVWVFSLEFSPVQQFLKQAQSFISINLLPNMERDMILYNTRVQKEAQAQFDTTNLMDLSEKICLNVPSAQVTPLVREPGRLVITQTHLYFQPLFNLNDDNPVRSEPLSAIIAVARRRHALRQVGLEIYFKEEDNNFKNVSGFGLAYGASAFFTFQNVDVRNSVANNLLDSINGQSDPAVLMESLLEAEPAIVQLVAKAWQDHRISNYDYLMYLNLAAGRSFCDLTQWPVMPWILRDYKSRMLDLGDAEIFRDLSKPIGALNPDRLAIFRDRYMQIVEGGTSDPPFLYGTHYSTPGYVLYWLVRAAPAHMLRLQNGRFDAPDRLYVSMEESWENVLSNAADLKELIPEFFSLPSDFLQIRNNLKLGIRQRGDLVGDVILPPWADDADDFIIKHRQALESEHVSCHLHEWIDLIFGFKQRGMAALAADNLFHHLSYEGTVDLEKIDDPVERAGLEVQVYSISDGLQLRSTKLGSLPLSSLALAKSTDAYPVVLAGSFDNCVYAYSVDYGRALGKVRVHDDTVSCLQIIESSSQQMVTASWDATVKIWSIDEGRGGWATAFGSSKNTESPSMEFVEHEGPVLCLDVGCENNILVSGSEDGSIIAWDPRTPTSIWHQAHGNKGSPAGLRLKTDAQEVLVAFEDGSFYVLDVRKGGTLLASHRCENRLKCCEVAGPLILAGSATGALYVWPLDIDMVNELAGENYLKCPPVEDHKDAINCISVSHKPSDMSMHIATASENGIVQ